jgi:hypothetical protein
MAEIIMGMRAALSAFSFLRRFFGKQVLRCFLYTKDKEQKISILQKGTA